MGHRASASPPRPRPGPQSAIAARADARRGARNSLFVNFTGSPRVERGSALHVQYSLVYRGGCTVSNVTANRLAVQYSRTVRRVGRWPCLVMPRLQSTVDAAGGVRVGRAAAARTPRHPRPRRTRRSGFRAGCHEGARGALQPQPTHIHHVCQSSCAATL